MREALQLSLTRFEPYAPAVAAYVSIRQHTQLSLTRFEPFGHAVAAYVSIRQHTQLSLTRFEPCGPAVDNKIVDVLGKGCYVSTEASRSQKSDILN